MFTVQQFFKRFPDDAACLQAVMDAQCDDNGRMPCVACQRNARWYRLAARKAFTCQFCGHHYYPCAGTIFQDSRTSLQSWLFAMYLFTTSRHGVPAKELQRQLGVTYKTAWRMGHQIRKLMAELEPTHLSGHVEVDETLVGGKAIGAGHSGWRAKKTIVMGMIERGGKRSRASSRTRRAVLCCRTFSTRSFTVAGSARTSGARMARSVSTATSTAR
jgi:transposase